MILEWGGPSFQKNCCPCQKETFEYLHSGRTQVDNRGRDRGGTSAIKEGRRWIRQSSRGFRKGPAPTPPCSSGKAPCQALSILSIVISHSDYALCHRIPTKQCSPTPTPRRQQGVRPEENDPGEMGASGCLGNMVSGVGSRAGRQGERGAAQKRAQT